MALQVYVQVIKSLVNEEGGLCDFPFGVGDEVLLSGLLGVTPNDPPTLPEDPIVN